MAALRFEQGQDGQGPGQDEGGQHEMESNAYDLGKILTEQFELPNLKNKGKKRSLNRYTYDLTDKHRGFGQLLDKKSTLRKIIETNISLGNLPDVGNIDPARFLISPNDLVYRILSREKDYESQALVFFLRDYSGSMAGKSTALVVAQHVMVYSWLLYQYAMQVETRFILHDTEAKEVPDFYTYYNSAVAGGTKVASAYRLVNEIVLSCYEPMVNSCVGKPLKLRLRPGLNSSSPTGDARLSSIPTHGIDPINANPSSITAAFTSPEAGNCRVDLWSCVFPKN